MRRLIVMRHAKSAWDTDAATDHERPLSKRGRRDAPRIGHELARRGWIPDLALVSDAARTVETWTRAVKALGHAVPVRYVRALYGAGLGAVQQVLEPLPDEVGTALILGHNPGFEHVACWLTGEDLRLTTGNAALLEHADGRWDRVAIDAGGWHAVAILRPKEL